MDFWDYKMFNRFRDTYFNNLITRCDIGKELFVTPIDTNTKRKLEKSVYVVFETGCPQYIIPQQAIDNTDNVMKHIKELMPIKVLETRSVAIGRDVFQLIEEYGKLRITAKQCHTVREFIDRTINVEHTNRMDQVIYGIFLAACDWDKICIRISTEPGFGKNSAIYQYLYLGGEAEVLEPKTIAKMMIRLENRILCLEEIANVKEQYRADIESIVGAVGDGRTEFDRPTRNMEQKSKEKLDISQLSLLMIYNNLDNSRQPDEYFDAIFADKTLNRAFPIRLTGVMNHKFLRIDNMDAEFEMVRTEMLEWTKSRVFYQQAFASDITSLLHGYTRTIEKIGNGDSFCRWDTWLDAICRVLDMYCESQAEFTMYEEAIVDRHKAYLKMVNKNDTSVSYFNPNKPSKVISTMKAIGDVKQVEFDADKF